MKEFLIQRSLQLIKSSDPNINETTLEEIEYGLVGLYLTFTKIIVIMILAAIFNIFTEVLIFMITFNVIRTCSFGLHATKSWICLLSSIIIFILIPYMCIYITLPSYIKYIISIITILLIYKNSPADTEKRPIINPKRRTVLKYLSTLIAVFFGICALCIDNNFYSNCFIFAPIVQCFIISPTVYKLFNLPYDNYKTYTMDANI